MYTKYEYTNSNQLYINLTKSVYIDMHFRPNISNSERLACARTRIGKNIKLANHNLKHVTNVKFLGVIIDDELSWVPQIDQLKGKLLSSLVL